MNTTDPDPPHLTLRNRLDNNAQRIYDRNTAMADLLIDAADTITRLDVDLWFKDGHIRHLRRQRDELRQQLADAERRAQQWEDVAETRRHRRGQ